MISEFHWLKFEFSFLIFFYSSQTVLCHGNSFGLPNSRLFLLFRKLVVCQIIVSCVMSLLSCWLPFYFFSLHVGRRGITFLEFLQGNVKLKTTDPFFSLLDMDEGCCSVQLIDGDGVFNVSGIEHFMKTMKLVECGLSYAVVSIMGPQSSGIAYEFLELLLSVFFFSLSYCFLVLRFTSSLMFDQFFFNFVLMTYLYR